MKRLPRGIGFCCVALVAASALLPVSAAPPKPHPTSKPRPTPKPRLTPKPRPLSKLLKPRPTPTPAPKKPSPSPTPDPNLVLRPDIGIAFRRPIGYRDSLPGVALRGGAAYQCTGPVDGGVSANINLTVRPGPSGSLPPGTAKALAGVLAKRFPKQSSFKVVKCADTKIAGGERAAVVSATMTMDGRLMRNCQVAVAHKGRLYVFTFTSSEVVFNQRVPALLQMIDTLRWIS